MGINVQSGFVRRVRRSLLRVVLRRLETKTVSKVVKKRVDKNLGWKERVRVDDSILFLRTFTPVH